MLALQLTEFTGPDGLRLEEVDACISARRSAIPRRGFRTGAAGVADMSPWKHRDAAPAHDLCVSVGTVRCLGTVRRRWLDTGFPVVEASRARLEEVLADAVQVVGVDRWTG